ncbi:MAG TPA: hypothetical protein PKW95_22255 [bacterium]|nr:hypothetical protein [bacterium]
MDMRRLMIVVCSLLLIAALAACDAEIKREGASFDDGEEEGEGDAWDDSQGGATRACTCFYDCGAGAGATGEGCYHRLDSGGACATWAQEQCALQGRELQSVACILNCASCADATCQPDWYPASGE